MKMNTFIVLGKPGSGKGTQAKLLAEKTGLKIFGASDHLRRLAAEEPSIGEKILDEMHRGVLVPHWIMSYLWTREIMELKPSDGIIFDGAVRKTEEARLFDEVMQWFGREYMLIYIEVGDDELKERLKKRAVIEGRDDDTEEAIAERLKMYRDNTQGSVDFFKEKGRLITINGEQPIEAVHADIMNALE